MREIIGNLSKWKFLKESFKNQSLAHAYLFYGPSGVGKKRIAIEFAKLILCEDKDKILRDKKCYQIENFIHPDIIFIKPDIGKSQAIPIEEIRKLKERMSLTSDKSYKIAIIDDAHKMTHDAQSALLKILEEPKGKRVIILITEFPGMILETIRSRTQQIYFHRVSRKEMEKLIKKLNLTEDEKKIALMLADGKPGVLLKMIENRDLFKEEQSKIEDLTRLKNKSLDERFKYAKKLKDDEAIISTLSTWLKFLRELLIEDKKSPWNKKQLLKIIKLLENIIYFLSNTNVNQRLALEIFFLNL